MNYNFRKRGQMLGPTKGKKTKNETLRHSS